MTRGGDDASPCLENRSARAAGSSERKLSSSAKRKSACRKCQQGFTCIMTAVVSMGTDGLACRVSSRAAAGTGGHKTYIPTLALPQQHVTRL